MKMAITEDWLPPELAHALTSPPAHPGRPLVSLCFAQSLDGSIAARRGEPTQLSGPDSYLLTHRLRAAHEAILVGSGTVLSDDPLLTARIPGGTDPQPVVLDSNLRIPLNVRVLSKNPHSAWVACRQPANQDRRTALETAGARVLELPADPNGFVSLPALLDCLGKLGIRRLMVEGGATVITNFLAEDLADWVILTIAPVFLGGLPAITRLLPGLRLRQSGCMHLGEDFIIWGSLR